MATLPSANQAHIMTPAQYTLTYDSEQRAINMKGDGKRPTVPGMENRCDVCAAQTAMPHGLHTASHKNTIYKQHNIEMRRTRTVKCKKQVKRLDDVPGFQLDSRRTGAATCRDVCGHFQDSRFREVITHIAIYKMTASQWRRHAI